MSAITVLIVDDHAVMRQGLRALLAQHADIQVVGEAKTGREALACVGELAPDIVIMDLSMPELNGIEATSLLRERSPHTRVVILSMHADAEYVYRALDAGAQGYVLKESAVDEIVGAIRAVHQGRRYIGSQISIEGVPERLLKGRSSPIESLSSREREVLQLVVEGHTSAEIAAAIHVSAKTVETYRSRLMKKLGVKDVPALVKFAIQHGLTPPH